MALLSKNWKWLSAAVALIALVGFFVLRGGADGAAPTSAYETIAIDRGSINQSVATSGSVRPLVTVQVGSQLSGQVAELLADFNSEVKEGDLIARIDPQTFQTRVEAAVAEKAVAEATLNARRADLRRAQAFVTQRKSDLDRFQGLGEEAGLSEVELDEVRTLYRAAIADQDSAAAQVANAEATVIQRVATLDQAEVDLARTEIRSPIDGVVILRSVDVGQTVAASLSAPVLFEIAQDLSRIQIEADVNEADIGAVSKDDPVSFTVDAYPDRTFSGLVQTVRLAPIELQNVVTYTVIIHADNPGRVLYPGMTATVEIITGQREDTLRIPNAAARFTPSNASELLASAGTANDTGNRRRGGGGRIGALAEQLDLTTDQEQQIQSRMRALFQGGGGGPGQGGQRGQGGQGGDRQKRIEAIFKSVLNEEQFKKYQASQTDRPTPKTVWVVNAEGEIEPRRIRLGIADGSYTEVAGGPIEEGDAIIVREASPRS